MGSEVSVCTERGSQVWHLHLAPLMNKDRGQSVTCGSCGNNRLLSGNVYLCYELFVQAIVPGL